MPLPYDDNLQLAAEGALLQGVEQVVEIVYSSLEMFNLHLNFSLEFSKFNLLLNFWYWNFK